MLMLIFIMFSHLNICDVRGHSFGHWLHSLLNCLD